MQQLPRDDQFSEQAAPVPARRRPSRRILRVLALLGAIAFAAGVWTLIALGLRALIAG
jgi:hypothetical protein